MCDEFSTPTIKSLPSLVFVVCRHSQVFLFVCSRSRQHCPFSEQSFWRWFHAFRRKFKSHVCYNVCQSLVQCFQAVFVNGAKITYASCHYWSGWSTPELSPSSEHMFLLFLASLHLLVCFWLLALASVSKGMFLCNKNGAYLRLTAAVWLDFHIDAHFFEQFLMLVSLNLYKN